MRSLTRHLPSHHVFVRPRCAIQVPSSSLTFYTSSLRNANILSFTATGPPPAAPVPSASQYGEQVSRRRRQAELLKRGQDLRTSQMKPGTAMSKRFWKDVIVKTEAGWFNTSFIGILSLLQQRIETNLVIEGTHNIYLDARPVRNPSTKLPLSVPASKPHLATAIAIEWDNLVSAQQALRSHLIPLTSIASRAQDISLQDTSSNASTGNSSIRSEIVNALLRYLDTDTILCWAPPPSTPDPTSPSLRELQIRVARPIIAHLTQHVWPGVELVPTLDAGSIVPTPQPEPTRAVIKGWLTGLPAWELAGLERAVLAGKSLCVGARLVIEWSEVFQGRREVADGAEHKGKQRFGIEEAAEACSSEVSWQTGRWGEVEDTHDVEKEDLRRQFGSVILVVSGTGNGVIT